MTELGVAPQTESRVRLTGVRRLIAERMMQSHREIPGVLIAEDCDVTGLDLRSLVSVVAHTVGLLVADYPALNAHLVDDELVCFARCDIGVAVDTPRGLMVPVVRDCAGRSAPEIQREIADLADRARNGGLGPADMRDATITLTSPGRRGGTLATPLISPPQTCIVGVHRAEPRPKVVDGSVQVRTLSTLTVTFDHRVIDGATAGDFAVALARGIERYDESGDQP